MASSNNGDGPWAAFLRLEKLELPKNFQSPEVVHTVPVPTRSGVIFVADLPAQSQEAFFGDEKVLDGHNLASKGPLGAYEYKKQLENRLVMDHFRRLFVYMFHYDLRELIRARSLPETRERPLRLQEVNGFLEGRSMAPVSDRQVADTINEDAEKGAILKLFIAKFGEGCVFYLGSELSEEFLSRCSQEEGLEMHKTIAKLTDLGLAKKAKESGSGMTAKAP